MKTSKHIYPILLFLTLLHLSAIKLGAQVKSDCGPSRNKEANKYYAKANERIRFSTKEAGDWLMRAIRVDSGFVDAFYLLAEIEVQNAEALKESVLELKPNSHYRKAELYFRKITEICPSFQDYISFFYLGEFYIKQKDYKQSKQFLQVFIDNNSGSYEELKASKSYLEDIKLYYKILNNPVPFNPMIVKGPSTSNDEYLPVLSPDGEYIFYTRNIKKQGARMDEMEESEALMFGKRIKNDSCEEFSEGTLMPPPFNKGNNQGGASITIDNQHFFLSVCNYQRTEYSSYKNCDIFVSDFEDGAWTPLRNLGPNINGNNSWEGQPSITAEGNILYFASARLGGFGGIDIYRSIKDSAGRWEKAENLGPVINTSADDKTPFIHSDGQTLYFSSNGRVGMGNFDIYYSQLQEDKAWSAPINIGSPINTPNDDLGLIVSSNGKKMYFASNQFSGIGGWDLFSADLYKEARPQKVLFVKGQVTDTIGKGLSNANVELQNIRTLKLTKGLIDPETGKYAVATSASEDDEYLMTFKRKGFFYNSKYIKPNERLFQGPSTMDIELKPVKSGAKIKLENIYFETNSANIEKIGKLSLDIFVEFLQVNPMLKIVIYGHTDNVGNDRSNMNLSIRRAQAVQDYLLTNGISLSRINFKGFGETRPVESNLTRKGRAANRRTEFVVIVR
jgi:outer membrane protein OmpA-like peptidoglycan-associated protein/tetratricopeptide (TPR) repeat protein